MLEFFKVDVFYDDGAFPLELAHSDDAGFDIRTPERVVVHPVASGGEHSGEIQTGIHVRIPKGYYGDIKSKSGLNRDKNIITTGVIDSGYTGSIMVKLYNLGSNSVIFEKGDKVAQLIITPYLRSAMLRTVEVPFPETERGDNGFGSSGR